MKSLIFLLPEDFYPIFQSFLDYEDYWYFINVGKHNLHKIKRKTIYFKLNKIYSNRFLENDSFRERIKSLVENPSQQISLRIHARSLMNPILTDLRVHRILIIDNAYCDCSVLPLLQNIKELEITNFSSLTNLSYTNDLQKLIVSGGLNLDDISALQNVPDVCLNECPRIEDFSVLGKQKKLRISYCKKLRDVTNLVNIHILMLSGCALLSDVSPLKNIPILFIGGCPLISDLSPLLGYHEKLTITNCSHELTGYHIFSNIPTVSLWFCNIQDVSVLKNAKSVSLHYCNDLVDITPLVHVKEIELSYCQKIVDLSMIGKIEGNLRPTRIARNRKRLELHLDYPSLLQIQLLPINLTHLTVSLNANVKWLGEGVKHLRNLQILRIESSPDVVTKGFEDIPIIQFYLCGVKEVSGLARNREVHLLRCNDIYDVSSLKDVPVVVIELCEKIIDYSCLAKVPRLKVRRY